MPKKATRGRKPSRLKLDGKWQDAVSMALAKKRPPEGWPEPDKPKDRKRRKKKKAT